MTKIKIYFVLLLMFAVLVLGVSSCVSARTAAEFKVRQEIALLEIARLDSTVFSERVLLQIYQEMNDEKSTQISLLTVEAKAGENMARRYQALADAAEVPVEYNEPDSVLVETINETVEPNDFIVLCADQYGFTKFCFTRSLAEDYLTMTLTIPALRNSRNSWRELAETHGALISTYSDQVGLQTQQIASLNIINVALTGRANEYEDLYRYAKRAYKRERLLRHATIGAVVAGAVAFLIVK